jgi:hypothetical protein
LPENFTISATTYYDAASGESCPGHKVIKSDQPKGTQLIELKLPLTEKVKGCSRVLKSVVLNIKGRWGERELDIVCKGPLYTSVMNPPKQLALSPRRGHWSFRASASGFFARWGRIGTSSKSSSAGRSTLMVSSRKAWPVDRCCAMG